MERILEWPKTQDPGLTLLGVDALDKVSKAVSNAEALVRADITADAISAADLPDLHNALYWIRRALHWIPEARKSELLADCSETDLDKKERLKSSQYWFCS